MFIDQNLLSCRACELTQLCMCERSASDKFVICVILSDRSTPHIQEKLRHCLALCRVGHSAAAQMVPTVLSLTPLLPICQDNDQHRPGMAGTWNQQQHAVCAPCTLHDILTNICLQVLLVCAGSECLNAFGTEVSSLTA